MRNEIYARHGRRFDRPDLQAHFEKQAWYAPKYRPDEFLESLLSEVERHNVEFIRQYQGRRR
jgi:serine/threonine-protein kinase